MKSLDKDGRSLEEVVSELLDVNKDEALQESNDNAFVTRALIQKLKGEMRKYLNRPKIYASQIHYIRNKITEIEIKCPNTSIN